MGNDADSDEYLVLSKIRPGLKREFEFALKSHSQNEPSIGRTRSNNPLMITTKRLKNEEQQYNDNEKSDLVNPKSEDNNNVAENAVKVENLENVEVKSTCKQIGENIKTEQVDESNVNVGIVQKKLNIEKVPQKLRDLLGTGLLDGLPVRYLRGAKVRGASNLGIQGKISGAGILCYCDLCHGEAVVTPNQFELHAGSSNKRPPEYIFLENGNTLRDVLNACKRSPSDSMEVVIRNAIGLYENKPTLCSACKGPIFAAGSGRTIQLCNSCMDIKVEPGSDQPPDITHRPALSVPALKSSDRMSNSSSSRSKSHGRITRKDLRMHKLVFEEDVLADGTALAYYARGQKLLEGYKKGCGIFCFCCNTEVSPSQFEAHAGWASRRKPYLHIYTSNGVSLHELSIGLAKQRKFSADENDDLCSICADGGDLLLCDNCPRAFHSECVGLPSIPTGTWYCKYCLNMFEKEKFVERNVNALAAGRVPGIDPLEQITTRCIRIVETSEADVGGCMLCRGHDFSKSGFGSGTVILCDQCEKEYHVGCLKEYNMDDLEV